MEAGEDSVGGPENEPALDPGTARLAVLKALGDNTRYAIYLELARSRIQGGLV